MLVLYADTFHPRVQFAVDLLANIYASSSQIAFKRARYTYNNIITNKVSYLLCVHECIARFRFSRSVLIWYS